MEVTAHDLILYGQTLDDYRAMFDLGEVKIENAILNVPGGLSSINAEISEMGGHVVSCDTLYKLNSDEISQYAEKRLADLLERAKQEPERFNWKRYASIENWYQHCTKAIKQFLDDYSKGRQEGRYLESDLLNLNFKHFQFNLALSAYYFFVRSELTRESQLKTILELCNVAGELRIYPLLNSQGGISENLAPLMLELQKRNLGVEVRHVGYEFQKGGNAMLRVWAQACQVV